MLFIIICMLKYVNLFLNDSRVNSVIPLNRSNFPFPVIQILSVGRRSNAFNSSEILLRGN